MWVIGVRGDRALGCVCWASYKGHLVWLSSLFFFFFSFPFLLLSIIGSRVEIVKAFVGCMHWATRD